MPGRLCSPRDRRTRARPPSGHRHAHDHRAASRRALGTVLALTVAMTVVEVFGGVLTGSLALLADAGHLFSDSFAIGLALGAIVLARRPSTARRSFGFQRAEILAAFVNGLTLVLVSGWIVWEAIDRLDERPDVLGGWMLAVAAIGLAVNALAATHPPPLGPGEPERRGRLPARAGRPAGLGRRPRRGARDRHDRLDARRPARLARDRRPDRRERLGRAPGLDRDPDGADPDAHRRRRGRPGDRRGARA